MTDRQQQIKDRLDKGMTAREAAADLGISRNAVYQQIQRMRRNGTLDADYTPTGQPVRELDPRLPGADAMTRLLATVDRTGNHHDLDPDDANTAGALALLSELKRTRDELDTIARRLSRVVPR